MKKSKEQVIEYMRTNLENIKSAMDEFDRQPDSVDVFDEMQRLRDQYIKLEKEFVALQGKKNIFGMKDVSESKLRELSTRIERFVGVSQNVITTPQRNNANLEQKIEEKRAEIMSKTKGMLEKPFFLEMDQIRTLSRVKNELDDVVEKKVDKTRGYSSESRGSMLQAVLAGIEKAASAVDRIAQQVEEKMKSDVRMKK